MSSIFKFFRITFFLVLYFFLCMVVVTTMLRIPANPATESGSNRPPIPA